MANVAVCDKCQGEGAYVVTEAGEDWVSASTTPCDCRKDEPPREGKAQWWTMEPIFSGTCLALVDDVEVEVKAEVPMSRDNHRLVRHGNRYYPTTVDLDVRGLSLTLYAEQARELAELLVKAAEACEAIDIPDTDPVCGHWAPCDCNRSRHAALDVGGESARED